MNRSQRKRYVAKIVTGLDDITLGFAGDIGRRPSSAELFEVLTWAAKSLSNDALKDVSPAQIIALKPKIKKSAKSLNSGSSAPKINSEVDNLNDSTFVIASDFLADVTNEIRSDRAAPPTLQELTDLLEDGLRQSGTTLLADIHPSDIDSVKVEVKKGRKISVQVGDIVAIPAKQGEYFITVILARNAFGVAYGFFKGTHKLKPISFTAHPLVHKYPIYSDDRQIVAGRWLIIGHDDQLRRLFPEEPEIYHQPGDYEDVRIGPYGAGETASGKLRDLTQAEAQEIGLLSGQYQQTYLSEYLEEVLNSRLGE